MAERVYLCNDWLFTEEFSDKLLSDNTSDGQLESVRIPHTVKELPFHYCNENDYQMISGYVKVIKALKKWQGKKVLLTFEAAGHEATVYLNGEELMTHKNGYTAFTIDISDKLNYGEDNRLVVKLNSKEDINVPPFGFVIDYMTYGGIYRDVYLDIKENTYIKDVFPSSLLSGKYLRTQDGNDYLCAKKVILNSKIEINDPSEKYVISQSIRKKGDGEFMTLNEDVKADSEVMELTCELIDLELWDVDNPALYEIKTEIKRADGKGEPDENIVTFGFRKAVFRKNGFYLNGRKLKIRGLNRHQSYPYVGYAMPDSMQINDADILKNELGVNAVRTSHYPQAHSFINRCDELGLLVFTEFPGWQHIGDEEWKEQAVENVREMILQYRNHPSIILWGVRINESVDDDELYLKTNAVAHELDETRQTGGVRCYKKGSLLEDVFTYNDFSHDGKHPGCEPKKNITPDMEKPYLISEYNGHMYPTKAFDWEEHRMEHAKRHANVLDEVAGYDDIAGSFGWCMFDYNTHKDFGSGDRICYHGVMDMFRNPKLAAAVYASQQDKTPVLEFTSSMDIGEHPGCNRGDVYIITNADSVKMYKNDVFIKEYCREDSPYKNLKHGPIRVDDYIGSTLEEGEKMPHAKAEAIKDLLNEVAKVGLYGMSKMMMAKAGAISLKYHMSMEDAVELFNRYIGNWGGESTAYRFDAIKNGEVVKSIVKTPMTKRSLSVKVSRNDLIEKHTYDVAAIRICATDENGNILPFANDPVVFETEGEIELIGPKVVSLQGGMFGTYVKSKGKTGKAKLKITDITGEVTVIDFDIREGK